MRRLLLLSAAIVLGAPAPGPEWRVIGPGGGGTLFYPTVSPHDPRTVLAACDMTGAYVTHNGGVTWKMVNLGAPPRFFAFDPRDARVMYAEANGLFRGSDGGMTWTRFLPRDSEINKATLGDDHAEARLYTSGMVPLSHSAFAIDPADSRSMLVATGSGQKGAMWQSLDGGQSWSQA